MRRTHLIVLAVAAAGLAVAGGSALAMSPGDVPLSASPDPLGFGTQAVGVTTPAKTVTFQNTGTVSLSVTGVSISQNGSDYNITNDNCTGGAILNVGDTCTVDVT